MPFCTDCGTPFDTQAKFCGQCGLDLIQKPELNQCLKSEKIIKNKDFNEKDANRITARIISGVFVLVIAIGGGSYLANNIPDPVTTLQQQGEKNAQSIRNKVAEDAVHQYYMVKNDHGGKIEKCVQAGFAAAAYLQAQDQHDYEQWHQTQRMDCAIAGITIQ